MNVRRAGFLAIWLLTAALPAAAQSPAIGACQDGVLPSGALSRICIPSAGWNGSLVVYAHGYVPANEPLAFYHLTLPDGTNVPNLVQALGFAFATTSYRQNGLAVVEGVDDIKQLVEAFPAAAGRPAQRVYIAGVSEGGLVSALAAERLPAMFTGALATCGPIGSFRAQVNYVGDLRSLFDVYFSGVIPGTPTNIPASVIANWNAQYVPAITAILRAHQPAATELLRVAHVPFDPANFDTVVQSTMDVLWYNIFGTNDAADKLGGNPYDNSQRQYSGSSNDVILNALVPRSVASPAALSALGLDESSGDLRIPMVTLHTIGDDVIPFGHEILYKQKVHTSGRGRLLQLPVASYGHCNFAPTDVLVSFLLLLFQP